MKAMIAMIIDRERKESELIWDGELSTSGHWRSTSALPRGNVKE